MTKLLKGRLQTYFARTSQDLSFDQITAMVAPYTSHSLKRGGITDAASKGANERELQVMFRFKNTKTPAGYVDQQVIQQLGVSKKPSLIPVSTTTPAPRLTQPVQEAHMCTQDNPYCAIAPVPTSLPPLKKRKISNEIVV